MWTDPHRNDDYLSTPESSSSPLTVCLADGRAVVRAEARLHLPPSDLQVVGVGQVGAAHVAHPLLLAGPALRHVDGHPGRPRGVPLHLWARLQVTGLVLLPGQTERDRGMFSFRVMV